MASKKKATAGLSGNGVTLDKQDFLQLYAVSRYLGRDLKGKLGLRINIPVRFKDPLLGAKDWPFPDIDKAFLTPWEPGLQNGPTSARFAVVDYDGTTGKLGEAVVWDASQRTYLSPRHEPIQVDTPGFRQASVWAILQSTLDFFEESASLGRSIDWAFEGNRLLVLPHAGYGQNAFYDRASKSLQFYYFDDEGGNRIYTSDSSDIVNHEFGHALLDAIRPHYLEAVTPQTAAFHEFMGDFTAILMSLRNNDFRKYIGSLVEGNLGKSTIAASIAQQFGSVVQNKPYLRTGDNEEKLGDHPETLEPHALSEVMTGTMFELMAKLSQEYLATPGRTVPEALWSTVQRMQLLAIQPLDLLPPVEVTFKDYAEAVLRADIVANPLDPRGTRTILLDVFRKRGILTEEDCAAYAEPDHIFHRLDLTVFHDVQRIAGSRAEAYRFLDNNRTNLFIPRPVDLVVTDLFTSSKSTREGRRMPRQVVLQYIWREEVELTGEQFGHFAGRRASMPCGATLVLDENGNLIAWPRKPGTAPTGHGAAHEAERAAGLERRRVFLDTVARRIKAGMIGDIVEGAAGLLPGAVPALVAREENGILRFELTPHLTLDEHEEEGAPWRMSS